MPYQETSVVFPSVSGPEEEFILVRNPFGVHDGESDAPSPFPDVAHRVDGVLFMTHESPTVGEKLTHEMIFVIE